MKTEKCFSLVLTFIVSSLCLLTAGGCNSQAVKTETGHFDQNAEETEASVALGTTDPAKGSDPSQNGNPEEKDGTLPSDQEAQNPQEAGEKDHSSEAAGAVVQESINSDGSRTITIIGSDGTTSTITIRSADGSPQTVSEGKEGSSNKESSQNQGQSTETGAVSETATDSAAAGLTFEEYCALSGDEQYAYYLSFPSTADFFVWYNAAKDAYNAANPAIEIGEGDIIDLGGGNSGN